MRKNLIFILFFVSCTLAGQTRVFENPAYEAKTTGLYNVTKVELGENDTRVHILCKFIHNWWTKFEKTDYIENVETGEKYFPMYLEGGEFGKEEHMPESSERSFVVIFPKLDASVKKINFGDDGKTIIWGIALDGTKDVKADASTAIPKTVQAWINKELSRASNKSISDLTDKKFFREGGKARLVGYLKGYDTRFGFKTGMIYVGDDISNEDFPTVVTIHPDGRFEATLKMEYPKIHGLVIRNKYINFYIEPGQTLGIVLDWDDFLQADRYRNITYKFKHTQYLGVTARLNQELAENAVENPEWREYDEKRKQLNPLEFNAYQTGMMEKQLAELKKKESSKKLMPQTIELLRGDIFAFNGEKLFDYESHLSYAAYSQNKKMEPLPKEYYAFLQQVPLNQPSFLVSNNTSSFINRFEFSNVFNKRYSIISQETMARKPYNLYLTEDKGLTLSAEDQYVKVLYDSIFPNGSRVMDDAIKPAFDRYLALGRIFDEKYNQYAAEYEEKYVTPYQKTELQRTIREWQLSDSILASDFNLKNSLTWEIIKVRSLNHRFKYLGDREQSQLLLTELEKGITYPFLVKKARAILNQSYPIDTAKAYVLPKDDKGTEVIRKIIDPFKGKYLFVDFWGTGCGPCRANIEEQKAMRAKYKGNEDFEFIFITSDNDSRKPQYDEYIKEQELEHSYYLDTDDFYYLRQLFKFNGIPRYVLFDPEGKVISDKFDMHNFEYALPKILGEKVYEKYKKK